MAPPRSKTSRKAPAGDAGAAIGKEQRDEPENPPTTVNPLCPHSLLFHAIDLTSYEILKDPLNRAERAATMEYYLSRIGADSLPSHGRLNTRVSMAGLINDFCLRPAYPDNTDESPSSTGHPSNSSAGGTQQKASKASGKDQDEDEDEDEPRGPLVSASQEEWDVFITMFQNIKKDLLRKDSNAIALPIALDGLEAKKGTGCRKASNSNKDEGEIADLDDSTNMEAALSSANPIARYNASVYDDGVREDMLNDHIFNRKFDEIVISMKFHQAMAGLRPALEKALRETAEGADADEGEVTGVSSEDLVLFEASCEKNLSKPGYEGAKKLLKDLLVENEKPFSLKPMKELREIYSRKEFTLDRFQGKVERLINRWNDAILDRPVMSATGYGERLYPSLDRQPERKSRKRREEKKRASQEEEDTTMPMADDDAGEDEAMADMKEDTSRKRRAPEDESAGEDSGPTGTIKRKKRRDKRDRVNKENVPAAPVEDGPEVKELAKARDHLREEVEDPLEDSLTLAATAAAASTAATTSAAAARAAAKKKAREVAERRGKIATPSIYKKKKTAQSLSFSDSEEEDSEEDGEAKGGTTLSAVPDRPVIRTAPASPERKPKPATQILAHRQHLSTGALKRKKFTEEEKSAIKLGIQKFGVGKWAKIKEYYSEELRDRNNVNIKDCYRTMLKNGEI